MLARHCGNTEEARTGFTGVSKHLPGRLSKDSQLMVAFFLFGVFSNDLNGTFLQVANLVIIFYITWVSLLESNLMLSNDFNISAEKELEMRLRRRPRAFI